MKIIFTLLLLIGIGIAIEGYGGHFINQAYAETDQHDHENENEGHDHENEDESHKHDEDDHGEQNNERDDHEGENEATIQPDAAKRAGIATDQVSPETLHKSTILTGRVMLNRDNTYAVRARFPGIVKKVNVRWGQQVNKGQVLATIESNDSLLTYSVYAPRSGVVLKRNTNVGDVANGDTLFTIADLTTVWAEFHIFPRDLPLIKEQQVVRIHALESNDNAKSKIDMLLPTADAASQTVIAIVPILNEGGIWRVGMIIEGHVEIGEKMAGLAVKEEALQTMNEKPVVFIKENEKTYVPREVEIGESDGNYVEILAGLQLGEEYVSQGSFRIKADLLKSTAEHEH
tara:strand:+ start:647 stop:1681 length:1035 start_codon:yes stop_codon:yes gene_type:complete